MTDQQLQQLIEQYHTPLHVRRHCAAVAKFAVELGKKLEVVGKKIDIELLRQAALLHDIVRVVDFRTFTPEQFPDPASEEDIRVWKELREKYKGQHHANAGAEILEKAGFPKHAKLVARHRYLQIAEGFDNWEEKLLYYADKRTKHDQRVPLVERLADGRKRNAPEEEGSEGAQKLDEKVFELEGEILAILSADKPI